MDVKNIIDQFVNLNINEPNDEVLYQNTDGLLCGILSLIRCFSVCGVDKTTIDKLLACKIELYIIYKLTFFMDIVEEYIKYDVLRNIDKFNDAFKIILDSEQIKLHGFKYLSTIEYPNKQQELESKYQNTILYTICHIYMNNPRIKIAILKFINKYNKDSDIYDLDKNLMINYSYKINNPNDFNTMYRPIVEFFDPFISIKMYIILLYKHKSQKFPFYMMNDNVYQVFRALMKKILLNTTICTIMDYLFMNNDRFISSSFFKISNFMINIMEKSLYELVQFKISKSSIYLTFDDLEFDTSYYYTLKSCPNILLIVGYQHNDKPIRIINVNSSCYYQLQAIIVHTNNHYISYEFTRSNTILYNNQRIDTSFHTDNKDFLEKRKNNQPQDMKNIPDNMYYERYIGNVLSESAAVLFYKLIVIER